MKKIFTLFSIIFFLVLSVHICFAAQDIKILVKKPDGKLSYRVLEEGKILVSIKDDNGEPVRGFTPEDFTVGRGLQKAEILSAEPLESIKEVPLNIVMVIDNSYSMQERRVVEPLLAAVDEFFLTIRPIDNIHLVVFDDKPRVMVREIPLHARTFSSNDIAELKAFLKDSLGRGMTGRTYLYDAMLAGVDIAGKMPAADNKFMVVFSDGEDLNSDVPTEIIRNAAQGIENFEVFSVDYMPGPKMDRFLQSFSANHDGRAWKATSTSELAPIFKEFTTTLLYRYLVSYSLPEPVVIEPARIDFDLLTMVDGSPVKNYIFFETGKSDIPAEYVLFKDKSEAGQFDAVKLANAWDKYLNILNIVGQDLTRQPLVSITITGGNANAGIEKENLDLSRSRAEAVSVYLSELWGIESSRMTIETRNLPQKPTPVDLVGARPENQRVEIAYGNAAMQADAPDVYCRVKWY